MQDIQEHLEEKIENKGLLSLQKATHAHQRYLLHTSSDDLTVAVNAYIDTMKSNPEIAETYYHLAALLYENKQISLDGAIAQCTQAVNIDPKNADAHMYLGYYLSLAGETKEAKERFKNAIRLKPFASARTRIIMALSLLEKKNTGAKNALQAAYCMLSGSLLFLVDKASIKMFFKNLADDVVFLKYRTLGSILESANKDKKAYELYHKALDESKNLPLFYEKMARIATKKQKDDIALHCYENAVKLSCNSTMALVNLIEFVEEKYPNKIDELIDSYNALVSQNPEFSRCYYELGHLHLKKNEKLNAVNAFRLALKYEPNNPFYLNSLAYSCVNLEQYDEAITYYKQALDINPDNDWSVYVSQALATVYHQVKGDSAQALTILNNSLLLTQNKAPVYQAIADIYYDLNDLDEAIVYYDVALQNDSKNSRAYSRLAMAYWEKDYVEKAIENYVKAINLDPDYDIAYNNLGVVFLDGLGDPKRAQAYFETAIDISEKYVLAHFNLARTFEAKNDKILAANEYQRALVLNKQNPEMEEELIQQRLFKLFDT